MLQRCESSDRNIFGDKKSAEVFDQARSVLLALDKFAWEINERDLLSRDAEAARRRELAALRLLAGLELRRGRAAFDTLAVADRLLDRPDELIELLDAAADRHLVAEPPRCKSLKQGRGRPAPSGTSAWFRSIEPVSPAAIVAHNFGLRMLASYQGAASRLHHVDCARLGAFFAQLPPHARGEVVRAGVGRVAEYSAFVFRGNGGGFGEERKEAARLGEGELELKFGLLFGRQEVEAAAEWAQARAAELAFQAEAAPAEFVAGCVAAPLAASADLVALCLKSRVVEELERVKLQSDVSHLDRSYFQKKKANKQSSSCTDSNQNSATCNSEPTSSHSLEEASNRSDPTQDKEPAARAEERPAREAAAKKQSLIQKTSFLKKKPEHSAFSRSGDSREKKPISLCNPNAESLYCVKRPSSTSLAKNETQKTLGDDASSYNKTASTLESRKARGGASNLEEMNIPFDLSKMNWNIRLEDEVSADERLRNKSSELNKKRQKAPEEKRALDAQRLSKIKNADSLSHSGAKERLKNFESEKKPDSKPELQKGGAVSDKKKHARKPTSFLCDRPEPAAPDPPALRHAFNKKPDPKEPDNPPEKNTSPQVWSPVKDTPAEAEPARRPADPRELSPPVQKSLSFPEAAPKLSWSHCGPDSARKPKKPFVGEPGRPCSATEASELAHAPKGPACSKELRFDGPVEHRPSLNSALSDSAQAAKEPAKKAGSANSFTEMLITNWKNPERKSSDAELLKKQSTPKLAKALSTRPGDDSGPFRPKSHSESLQLHQLAEGAPLACAVDTAVMRALNRQVGAVMFELRQQSGSLEAARNAAYGRIARVIRACFGDEVRVFPYGSFATKILTPFSDIDICISLQLHSIERAEVVGRLQTLHAALEKHPCFTKLSPLWKAHVPLLKIETDPSIPFEAEPGGFGPASIKADVTVFLHEQLGEVNAPLRTTAYVQRCAGYYPVFARLMALVKFALGCNDFLGSYQGGINSFGLGVLLVAFLESTGGQHAVDLACALHRFGDFLSRFDHQRVAVYISPYHPSVFIHKPYVDGTLTVYDPTLHYSNVNVTPSCTLFPRIQALFKRFGERLAEVARAADAELSARGPPLALKGEAVDAAVERAMARFAADGFSFLENSLNLKKPASF